MAWLRLDDGFDSHPKVLELTEIQRWRWTRALIHCARHRTEGAINTSVLRELGLSRTVPQLLKLGLLEEAGTGYVVHDWAIYNGATIADKVASFLSTNPDASANEVHRAIGGTREIVLSEVARQRPPPGSSTGTAEPVDNGSEAVRPNRVSGSESGSEIGSHAREPVPSQEELPRAVQSVGPEDDELDLAGEPGPNDDEPGPPTEQPSDFTPIRNLVPDAYLQEHIP